MDLYLHNVLVFGQTFTKIFIKSQLSIGTFKRVWSKVETKGKSFAMYKGVSAKRIEGNPQKGNA